MTAKLLVDIISYNYKVRGKKGDSVKIISDRDGVFIVEDSKGNRYSVKSDKLKINEPD